jgi:hypothetical protein
MIQPLEHPTTSDFARRTCVMKMQKKVRRKSKVDSCPRLTTGAKVTPDSRALILYRRMQNGDGTRLEALRKNKDSPPGEIGKRIGLSRLGDGQEPKGVLRMAADKGWGNPGEDAVALVNGTAHEHRGRLDRSLTSQAPFTQ